MAGKVQTIITDGGSNFVKAFSSNLLEEQDIELVESDGEMNVDVEESDYDGKERDERQLDTEGDPSIFESVSLLDILNDDSNNSIRLPRRTGCAAHKLNLIMTSDIQNSTMTDTYNNLYASVIAKFKEIWRKQNMSGSVADLIQLKLGRFLTTPVSVRWKSLFESLVDVKTMMETKRNEFRYVFESLGIPQLATREVAFLKEIISVKILVNSSRPHLSFRRWHFRY